MAKLDAKAYGEIRKVKDDSIIPDDEYIVFQVKDAALLDTLRCYRDKCIELGSDHEQIEAVGRMIHRVMDWQWENSERVKVPDARGEKLLDQDEAAAAPPARYRHKKRGSTYTVISDDAQSQVVGESISEGDRVVVYRSDVDGSVWVRPHSEFHDGRFEKLSP